ncbi:protein FAM47E-like isoform X2 [Ruditapes philippinarum]|uniref:protein FAM47E-like isoform X2 n=1 Tax=Ruditapes philippinarum TaxID=129788 RepID=UPI00295AFF9C|nr:protein FAM47E-like isoform X2 [Ruditapes philippinarum]
MSLAEQKYNLALVNTVTDKKIQQKPCAEDTSDRESDICSRMSSAAPELFNPWGHLQTPPDLERTGDSPRYKERLQTKYIKARRPSETDKNLVGKNWLFLKDGLDDFRDGLPPPVEGDITLKSTKGPGPTIKNSSENLSDVKQPAVRKRFNKHQICYSRLTPLQQQRREHINQIEYGLTQHPLALYPHLEESVNPELFEDIMNILDPEMNLIDDEEGSLAEEDEDENEDRVSADSDRQQTGDISRDEDTKTELRETEEGVVRNPYKWISKKEEQEKKNKKKAGEKPTDTSQEEHIKKVTKEFCDWVASLGGQSNNIEESTITSLFASGYETKPALSVPIHVVELTNVPPELRMSATVPQQSQQNKNLPQEEMKKTNWQYSGQYEPSWVKFKYGAWYLDPKSWQKRDADEPLMDPKELKDKEMSEAKKMSKGLNNELATMHGVSLFKEFVDKKSRRKPEFLDEVEEIKKRAEEEEQRRIEAELAAKKKRSHIKKSQDGDKTPA